MGAHFAAELLRFEDAANEGKLCPCDTYMVKSRLADVREHAAEVRQQLDHVSVYVGKLLQLEQEIKQGPRFQRHRLENRWSKEEQKGLDTLLETLDITPPHNEWMKGTKCVPAVKEGIVYVGGKNLYILPNFMRGLGNIGNAVMLTGLIGGSVAAAVGVALAGTTAIILYPEIEGSAKYGDLYGWAFVGTFLFMGGITATGSCLLSITKNPFTQLAAEMEKRAAYVRQFEDKLLQ